VEWEKAEVEGDVYRPNREGFAFLVASGKPQLVRDLAASTGQTIGPGQHSVRVAMGLNSAVCVPVHVRGRTIAVATLANAESSRGLDDQDLSTAQELARHIALAMESALLYQESQEMQEDLRRANEAKDEFLGLMSHELRTPITTLYGGAKILRARNHFIDKEQQESLLEDIETEAEGMHRMIEDLLVLARTGSGERVATEPLLANHLTDKVVRGFQLHKPNRMVEVHCQPDLMPVLADTTYFEQVLRNLLSNADKYSPASAPIEVELWNHGDEVIVAVRDRGSGIDPEEAELIFARFYRAERTARGVRGMGLGLTVCRKLTEAQGGRIWAARREGGGTEVAFALPAFRATLDEDE
jgi:K+-sensing histidine kinase KdpD